MAILFIDGFDSYGVDGTNATTIIGTYLDNTGNASVTIRSATRFGIGFSCACIDGNSWTSMARMSFPDKSIATVGMAVVKQNAGSVQVFAFGETGASDFQVGLQSTAGNKFVVRRGNCLSGTPLATGSRVVNLNEWNYVEMKVGIHATTGFVELRVNNVTDILVTGVNTKNTANSVVNRVLWGGGNAYQILVDDAYITDETLPNSGFLGDCRVQTLLPTGNGQNNTWTASGAASGWDCVNDTPAQVAGTYSDTDFVYGSSTGIKFEYSLADLSGTSPTVFGIAISNVTKKGDAGARTCQNLLYTNSAEASGAAYNLSTSYANYTDLFNTNPITTTAWTPTDVNNLQIGQLIAT